MASFVMRLAIVILVSFFSMNGLVQASDWPTTPPEGWWWYYGQTAAQVDTLIKANNARLVSIQVEQASPLLFTVAMVQNTGPYRKAWRYFYDQTDQDIGKLAKQLNARLVNLDTYEVRGQTKFAASFLENTGADAKAWWWYFGQTPDAIGALVQQNNARLIDLRQYSANGATHYAAVMIANVGADARSWWWYYNISETQVAAEVQKNGASLISLQLANPNNNTFNVIMERLPTPGLNAWWWYYGQSSTDVTNVVEQNTAWLRDVKTYNVEGRRVFTALMLGSGGADSDILCDNIRLYFLKYNAEESFNDAQWQGCRLCYLGWEIGEWNRNSWSSAYGLTSAAPGDDARSSDGYSEHRKSVDDDRCAAIAQ